jgi:hypothetical protein
VRTSQLCSFFSGAADPSTLLPYQGYDVLQKLARPLGRALVALDHANPPIPAPPSPARVPVVDDDEDEDEDEFEDEDEDVESGSGSDW